MPIDPSMMGAPQGDPMMGGMDPAMMGEGGEPSVVLQLNDLKSVMKEIMSEIINELEEGEATEKGPEKGIEGGGDGELKTRISDLEQQVRELTTMLAASQPVPGAEEPVPVEGEPPFFGQAAPGDTLPLATPDLSGAVDVSPEVRNTMQMMADLAGRG